MRPRASSPAVLSFIQDDVLCFLTKSITVSKWPHNFDWIRDIVPSASSGMTIQSIVCADHAVGSRCIPPKIPSLPFTLSVWPVV
jgi:hypothetical protein